NPLVNWDEYDYKTVFWHEALHGVGVEHHNDPRGLMFPSYTGAKTKLHLSDKHAIKNVLR
ncbi:MAG: matrixin family metalloprotease, partial [Ilumatobacteraceae bacterium]